MLAGCSHYSQQPATSSASSIDAERGPIKISLLEVGFPVVAAPESDTLPALVPSAPREPEPPIWARWIEWTIATARSRAEEATAQGAGIDAWNAPVPDVEALSVDLPGGPSVSGGGLDMGSVLEIAGKAGTQPLFWIGGITIAVGIGLGALLGQWMLGAAIGLAGAMIIAAGVLVERYPWVFALAFLAGLAVAVLTLWRAWKGGRTAATLRTVAAAVESIPEGIAVKKEISKITKAAGTKDLVKDTITAVKREADL